MAFAAWTVLCAYSPAIAADPSPPGASVSAIGLSASQEVLWAFATRIGGEATTTRFAYRFAGGDNPSPFVRLPIPAVAGEIALTAVRGRDLHVFFRDGTHRRFTPPYSTSTAWPTRPTSPMRFTELNFPRSALPLALTCDSAQNALFAVVTARQAAHLPNPEPETATGNAATEQEDSQELHDEQANSEPAVRIEAEEPPHYVIVRYAGGAWSFDRAGPDDLQPGQKIIDLLVDNGKVHLFHEAGLESTGPVHRVSLAAEESWTPPISIPTASEAESFTASWESSHPLILVGQESADGMRVTGLAWIDDAWTPRVSLVEENGQPVTLGEQFAAATFDGQLALASVAADDEVHLGLWSLATGQPTEPSEPVAALAPQPARPDNTLFRELAQYTLLLGALTIAVIWRRDRALYRVPLQPTQVVASFSRRFLALVIDLGLLVPVWIPTLGLIWFYSASAMGVPLGGTFPQNSAPPGAFWSFAIIGGIFGIYATIFEAVMGATPGKRLLGLSVVGDGGKPCRFSQIVVRNLVRALEFHFPPLMILLAMTPARQRLGDLFALTVVVETAPETAAKPPM